MPLLIAFLNNQFSLKNTPHPHNIGIVSLGCAKNLVDTEVLMRQLDANHYSLVTDPDEKDKIDTAIINTCGFILDAKQESIDTILRFVRAKKEGRIENLFVMGCLSQRYKDQLKKEIPEVDDFFGVNDLKNIIKRVGGKYKYQLAGERILTTPSHFAYLKIAEGCDRKCSFCSIPLIRGNHVSRPLEDIVKEAKNLVNKGVKEINLISQDTTYYGLDIYHQRRLADLLIAVSEIKGLEWLRLHYTYPDGFPLQVLEVMRERPNICKYIDIPLQHISSRILKSMRRGIDKEGTIELVNKIREMIPGVAIRTTLITGYPGESVGEFNELKRFVQDMKFDRLGVFAYSHEENTHAYNLKDTISPAHKQKRVDELMAIQEDISLELNTRKINSVIKVIIDRKEEEFYIGRTEIDSPEIDNEVLIPLQDHDLRIGYFYNARIISAESFDLFAKIQN
jgi:ribosomal protein S12 methylthiotransferase